MTRKKRLGLAFSGGGYRAAAFHLGTLKKLHALGLLNKVDVLSTVSGGSIAGAFFLLNFKGDFEAFEAELRSRLKKSTLLRIALNPLFIGTLIFLLALPIAIYFFFTWYYASLIFLAEIIGLAVFQFSFFPLTRYKIKAYEKIFFGNKKLSDLPNKPWISINASNLETGTLFNFSQNRMTDSSYAYPIDNGKAILFNEADFPVSHAVASSTCVPFGFNPLKIEEKYFKNMEDRKRVNPMLVDGGIYDNQGIHKMTQANSSFYCDIVICSDGSMPFTEKFSALNSLLVFYRATDVMMRKIKNLQFIRDVYKSEDEIAYFSLNWEYERVFDELVTALKTNNLKEHLKNYYNLPVEWLVDATTIEKNRLNIKKALKSLIDYEGIKDAPLTLEEIQEICHIGTNLTSLNDRQIDLLSRHASRLVEMHVKLFIPSHS